MAPDGFRVSLEFLDLDFAGDGLQCYKDRLDVYEGKWSSNSADYGVP